MDKFDKLLVEKLRVKKRKASLASYDARLAVENRVSYGRSNGHRKEPTGRVAQINFRGKVELKETIEQEAKRLGILKAELLERMWIAYCERMERET